MSRVGVVGAALLVIAVAALLAGGTRTARAHHLCANTGSPFGPFDLQTYEAEDPVAAYGPALELAGANLLFPEIPSFALPKLEAGDRSQGSAQTRDPFIPPALLKAIGWLESSWIQADYSVPYGSVGPVLVSHDCGYGIMQITTGMQNVSGVPNLDQAMIGGHYAFNIARGARILADKWNLAPEYRPIVGKRDPTITEDWYYAVWGYNGFAFKNHPLNPDYPAARVPFSCGPDDDGFGHNRSQYPYQELVLGCVQRPPTMDDTQMWSPQEVQLPDLSKPEFGGPMKLENWSPCSLNLDCAAMDIPTPGSPQPQAAIASVTRADVIGSPALSLSASSMTLVTVPPVQNTPGSLDIVNSGTGVLAWRMTSSAAWLKVSRLQGVALGQDLGGTKSTVTVQADPIGLPPGKYAAQLTIESLYASGVPATVNVTLHNFPDGTLLRGSGTQVYVLRGGLKRHVPNPATFEVNELNWPAILKIPDNILGGLPAGQPLFDVLSDGNLVRGSRFAVYVMEGGQKRHLPSQTAMGLCGYKLDAVYVLRDRWFDAIPVGEPLSGPPCPRLSPPAGTLLQGSGPAVYTIQGELKRHIPNRASFEALGFQWGNVDRVPVSALRSIASGRMVQNVLSDGYLLRGSGTAVYVMEGGIKRHVTSPSVMGACGYGFDGVYLLTDARLATIATGEALSAAPCPRLVPPDGSLLQGLEASIYLVQGGLKRLVPNSLTFEARGLLWANLDALARSYLQQVPDGQPLLDALADGTLLKGSGSAVYVLEGGTRRHVTSPAVLAGCGYGWDAVTLVSDGLLTALAEGPPLSGAPCPAFTPPDGTLLQGSDATVFVMELGARRHIASDQVFLACGYQWGNLNLVPDSALAAIPPGQDLTAAPCPQVAAPASPPQSSD